MERILSKWGLRPIFIFIVQLCWTLYVRAQAEPSGGRRPPRGKAHGKHPSWQHSQSTQHPLNSHTEAITVFFWRFLKFIYWSQSRLFLEIFQIHILKLLPSFFGDFWNSYTEVITLFWGGPCQAQFDLLMLDPKSPNFMPLLGFIFGFSKVLGFVCMDLSCLSWVFILIFKSSRGSAHSSRARVQKSCSALPGHCLPY